MRNQRFAALALVGLAFTFLWPIEADTLLVANKSDDTVDLIDLHSGKSAATLPTGHSPHEIAVSPDGTLAVVTNYGDRDRPGSSLTVIDLTGPAVEKTIDLKPNTRPHGVTFIDGDSVAVTTEGSSRLLVVNISDGKIEKEIETGQEISHMVATTPDGRRAFVANIGSHNVTVIDLVSGKKLRDIPTGEGAEGIAVSPDGKQVWVANREADSLSVIDTRSLEILESLACPGFPIRVAFTPSGHRVLVSAARTGEVVVFDTENGEEIIRAKLDLSNAPDAGRRLFGDRFGESPVPVGLVVSASGDTVWIAATQADAIVVVDPEDLTVRNLLRAGHEPDGMAVTPLDIQPTQPVKD